MSEACQPCQRLPCEVESYLNVYALEGLPEGTAPSTGVSMEASEDCQPCQKIACHEVTYFDEYALQGLPAIVPTIVVIPPTVGFYNGEVSVYCEAGLDIFFTGTLPFWITVDYANNRLVGASGIFFGATKDLANAAAQEALNTFAVESLASGKMACQTFSNLCPVLTTNYPTTGSVFCASYVSTTNRVWLGEGNISLVIKDAATGVDFSTELGVSPTNMLHVPSVGRMFFADGVSNFIQARSAITSAYIGNVGLAFDYLFTTEDSLNGFVYVQNTELSIYSSSSFALVASTTNLALENFSQPAHCSFNDRVYVPVDAIGIRIYNPHTGVQTGTIATGAAYIFYGAVYCPTPNKVVAIANDGVNQVAIFINCITNTINSELILPNFPQSVFFNPNAGQVYALENSRDFDVIDPALESIICTNSPGGGSIYTGCIAFVSSDDTIWIPQNLQVDVWDK